MKYYRYLLKTNRALQNENESYAANTRQSYRNHCFGVGLSIEVENVDLDGNKFGIKMLPEKTNNGTDVNRDLIPDSSTQRNGNKGEEYETFWCGIKVAKNTTNYRKSQRRRK